MKKPLCEPLIRYNTGAHRPTCTPQLPSAEGRLTLEPSVPSPEKPQVPCVIPFRPVFTQHPTVQVQQPKVVSCAETPTSMCLCGPPQRVSSKPSGTRGPGYPRMSGTVVDQPSTIGIGAPAKTVRIPADGHASRPRPHTSCAKVTRWGS